MPSKPGESFYGSVTRAASFVAGPFEKKAKCVWLKVVLLAVGIPLSGFVVAHRDFQIDRLLSFHNSLVLIGTDVADQRDYFPGKHFDWGIATVMPFVGQLFDAINIESPSGRKIGGGCCSEVFYNDQHVYLLGDAFDGKSVRYIVTVLVSARIRAVDAIHPYRRFTRSDESLAHQRQLSPHSLELTIVNVQRKYADHGEDYVSSDHPLLGDSELSRKFIASFSVSLLFRSPLSVNAPFSGADGGTGDGRDG